MTKRDTRSGGGIFWLATLFTLPAISSSYAQQLDAAAVPEVIELPGIVVDTDTPPPPISRPSARDPGPAAQARPPERVRRRTARRQAATTTTAPTRGTAPTQPVASRVEPASATVRAPNRADQDIADVATATTVIGAVEIERARGGGAEPSRLLEASPGVTVRQSGGVGGTTDVRIRGAESDQTLVMIDGVRINDPASTGSEFDFSVLSVVNVDRIEVLRGPQSGLYGSDAIGGVVNIIPKTGEGPPSGFAEIEGGSFSTFSQRAGVSGSEGRFSYAVGLSNFRTSGFNRRTTGTERDGAEKQSISGLFGYDVSETDELTLRLGYYRVRADLDGTNGDERDEVTRELFDSALTYRFASFNGLVSTRVTGYANQSDRDFLDFGSRTSEFTGFRAGLETQTDVTVREDDRLAFGGRYARIGGESTDISERTGTVTPRYDVIETHGSLFALYDFNPFDVFTFTVAGRLDDFGTGDFESTYRLSAAYRIPQTATKFRASFGTGAKAPTIQQRFESTTTFFCDFASNVPFTGNPDLAIETSRGFDVGIDQSLLGGRLDVSATYFHNEIKDLIEFTCNDTDTAATFENLPSATIEGVELAGEWRVVDGVRLRGTYTYTDAVDDSDGTRLRRRPDHIAKVTLAVEPFAGAYIATTLVHQSHHFDRSGERNKVDGFVRLDLDAEYTLAPEATLFLRAENLTDEIYQEVRNFATPRRSAYGGIRVRF